MIINALIDIKFILITESVSFLPNDIRNSFKESMYHVQMIIQKLFKIKIIRPENMQFITNIIMNYKEKNAKNKHVKPYQMIYLI